MGLVFRILTGFFIPGRDRPKQDISVMQTDIQPARPVSAGDHYSYHFSASSHIMQMLRRHTYLISCSPRRRARLEPTIGSVRSKGGIYSTLSSGQTQSFMRPDDQLSSWSR